jgi:hypothetical protein
MDFHNMFPCIWFKADFILHYTGTIPAIVQSPIIINTYDVVNGDFVDPTGAGLNWMEYLYSIGEIKIEAWRYKQDPGTNNEWYIDYTDPVGVGYQLHNCNYVYVLVSMHIPQYNMYQGLSGKFTTDIGVIQWYDPC